MALAGRLQRAPDANAAFQARQIRQLPVAYVPVHPQRGPMWAAAIAAPAPDVSANPFPLMEVYERAPGPLLPVPDLAAQTLHEFKLYFGSAPSLDKVGAMWCALHGAFERWQRAEAGQDRAPVPAADAANDVQSDDENLDESDNDTANGRKRDR